MKRHERQNYQHGVDQRTRRASERESHHDSQFRSKYDRTPVEGQQRHRRDSERTGSGKISLKKSLSRPDSKLDSRRSQERVVNEAESPFRMPQVSSKSSKKQLFSESLSASPANVCSYSDRKKKKGSKSLFAENYIPNAWKNFNLNHDLILQAAFSRL